MQDQEITTSNSPADIPRVAQIGSAYQSSLARQRWYMVGRVLGILTCLLFMAIGTVFGNFYWYVPSFHNAINNHSMAMVGKLLTGRNPLDVYDVKEMFPARTTMNLLVLGVDHDYDNRDQIVRASLGRSDSILLARVDFINKRIDALTIPRDTAVRIPGRSHISKINAAHNFGGPELTMETIKSVFGVDSDACVVLNFEGFQQIVDAIGGIDVDVSKKLDYDDNWGNLHIHLKPGFQHMNGYKAMGFVRMRHSDSDEMRSKRQHEFLEAMRTKVKSPGTFMSLPAAVNKLTDNLKLTNLSEDQLFALVNFARTLPNENIHIEVLPSYEGPSYVTVDAAKSAEVIQRLFFPNQFVALNIDAPDAGTVRAMNAPYERGRRHGKHGKEITKPVKPVMGDDLEIPAAPKDGLSVEPAPETMPSQPVEPSTTAPSSSGDPEKPKSDDPKSGAGSQ